MADPSSPASQRPKLPPGVWLGALAAGPELLFGFCGLVTRLSEYADYGVRPNPAALAAALVAIAAGIALIVVAVSGHWLGAARSLNVLLWVLIPIYVISPNDTPPPDGGPMPPDPHGYVSIFFRFFILPVFLVALTGVIAAIGTRSMTRWCAATRSPSR